MTTMGDHVPPTESAVDRIRRDPALRTRDDSGVLALILGTVAWGIAWLVVALVGRPPDGTTNAWLWICAAGTLVGLPGIAIAATRARRRSRAARVDQE